MRLSESRLRGSMAAFLLFPAGLGLAGEINGRVTAPGMKSQENIVVYVDTVAGRNFPAPAQHAVIDVRSLKFVPRVIAVLRGTTADFLNSDLAGHNVFWPSIGGIKKLGRNLGTWPKGTTKSYTFENLGVAPLLCNVHPAMSGYVVVVPTPYFALTDKEGRYEIRSVPPGKYVLKTWSEEGRPTTRDVEVDAGGAVAADLTIHH